MTATFKDSDDRLEIDYKTQTKYKTFNMKRLWSKEINQILMLII